MVVEQENPTLPPGDDGNAVTYEELAEVEKKFEDVDIWLSMGIFFFKKFVCRERRGIEKKEREGYYWKGGLNKQGCSI